MKKFTLWVSLAVKRSNLFPLAVLASVAAISVFLMWLSDRSTHEEALANEKRIHDVVASELVDASKVFVAATKSGSGDLQATLGTFEAAIERASASGAGVEANVYRELITKTRLPVIKDRVNELDKLDAEPPQVLEKPNFEKPEYTGAREIVGEFVGPFRGDNLTPDGIVVRSNGELWIISGAERPGGWTNFIRGYIRPSGGTITLSNGREAKAAMFALYEDARDYAQEYRRELSEATSEYRKAMAEYKEALKTAPER